MLFANLTNASVNPLNPYVSKTSKTMSLANMRIMWLLAVISFLLNLQYSLLLLDLLSIHLLNL